MAVVRSLVIEQCGTGSPHQVAYRERDIHQEGVIGDGESGGSGDEERE